MNGGDLFPPDEKAATEGGVISYGVLSNRVLSLGKMNFEF